MVKWGKDNNYSPQRPQFMEDFNFFFFPREMTVFKECDSIYHSKVLSFYRKEGFGLEAFYENPRPFIHVPQIGMSRPHGCSQPKVGL